MFYGLNLTIQSINRLTLLSRNSFLSQKSVNRHFLTARLLKGSIRNPNSYQTTNGRSTFQIRRFAQTNTVDKGNKVVGTWLLGCSAMVFGAVILGGVTRLTESGLSMVTWKLLGEQRPRTEKEWQEEFERYKEFPEFKMKNSNMTLEEFKFIYFMEYTHRMWGRAIGAFFAIPAVYFWARGYFAKSMKIRVAIFGSLIAAQGLMGWYMVQSGLEDRFQDVNDVPRVSQYRLALHLSFAFVLYTLFLHSSLGHLLPAERLTEITRGAIKFRKLAHVTKGMIFLTAVSGAFVAGLDAGLVYNSFPKMANKWIPDDIMTLKPKMVNFTENPTTVQFDHRMLGITTISLISGLWILSRRRLLPKRAYWAVNAIATMGWTQVALGITTLLTYVPVSIAALHQSGSLILLSLAIWLQHELKLIKYIPK